VLKTLRLTSVGLGTLCLGSLVYVVVRPEGSSYLGHVIHFAFPVSLEHFPFINNLPSLFHILGFSLLTVAVLGECKYALVSCLFWLGVNLVFEVAQHPYFVQFLDGKNSELPRVLDAYVRFGTFDVLDILFSAFGAVLAYAIVMLLGKPRQS
jgi:hypothetical protein